MPTGGHRDLAAWQKGMELVGAVYRLTARLPERERFGLTSQLRRAVIAVPVNLAEGRRQRSDREFRRYVSIAHGSLREVEVDVVVRDDPREPLRDVAHLEDGDRRLSHRGGILRSATA